MKYLCTILFCSLGFAQQAMAVGGLPQHGVLGVDNQKVIDPRVNYARFMGRVTDRDDSLKVFKIQVENNNAKFFKPGDQLTFGINRHDDKARCEASVQAVEDYYFTIKVSQLSQCWDSDKYFPRGMQLNFNAPKLAQRVLEASMHRTQLVEKKEDFLKQLSEINHFLWTYHQQKMQVASDYDRQINELQKQKRQALDNLTLRRVEGVELQAQLKAKLNELDHTLEHYRVDRSEYLMDRWNMDQDLGHPMRQAPVSQE